MMTEVSLRIMDVLGMSENIDLNRFSILKWLLFIFVLIIGVVPTYLAELSKTNMFSLSSASPFPPKRIAILLKVVTHKVFYLVLIKAVGCFNGIEGSSILPCHLNNSRYI
jgi:hypothetical protein